MWPSGHPRSVQSTARLHLAAVKMQFLNARQQRHNFSAEYHMERWQDAN
jgi:hypothetical protein